MSDKKRINVLYVHANHSDIGGGDYCLFKLAAELDKNVFNPIMCFSERTEVVDLYEKEGIKFYLIDMVRIQKSLNPLYLIKLGLKFLPTVWRIRKIIRKEQVSIIHGNDLLDIYGSIAGNIEHVPHTQYIRQILVSPKWLKTFLTKMVYAINDKVLTVSDGVAKAMFSSSDGEVLPNIVTCYDWVDMSKVGHSRAGKNIRDFYRIDQNAPLIGCVGRIERWKGQDVFIRAAAIVIKEFPNAHFLVVGDVVRGRGREAFLDELQDTTKKLGIINNVTFTGRRSDIADVMLTLDVFVHSSVTPDPLPGVVMEAMYCERPVVGANAGGVPEEVNDGVTGLLYHAGNHEDMAERICQLLHNPDMAKHMGIKGKKRVENIFSKTVLCKQMEDFYLDLMEGR